MISINHNMQKALEYINCNLCGNNETKLLFDKDGYKHVKCNSCGLIYVNPRLKDPTEALDSFYTSDKTPDDFTKDLISRNYSVKRQKKFCAELKKIERYRKLNKLLDVGCSFGGFLYAAKNSGWEAKGVEVTYEVGKHGKELHDLDIFFGTLEEAPFTASSFDVIRLNNIIEHIPGPSEFFTKINSLLRKGGLLVVSTPNYDSLSVLVCGKKWIYFDGQHHLFLFTPTTLKKLLAKSGFTTKHISTKGFHTKTGNNTSQNLIKGILLKLLKKIIFQFIRFTKKGHRLLVLAEKNN